MKSVNARVCLKLLEYLVLLVVQRANDTIGDALFQQDSAPVHTASVVTEWFEQQNIQVDEHPLLSRPQSYRTCLGSSQATASQTVPRHR